MIDEEEIIQQEMEEQEPKEPTPDYEELLDEEYKEPKIEYEAIEDKKETEYYKALEKQHKEEEEKLSQEEANKFFEETRKEISQKIINFCYIDKENKVLGINAGAGTGKTITAGVTLQNIDDEIQTIFLGERVEEVKKHKEEIEQYTKKDWKHILGIKQFIDDKNLKSMLDELGKYYINISDLLKKELKKKGYYKQKEYVKNKSWFGQHAHLTTKFIEESFENSNKIKLIVLDENPIKSTFLVKKEITSEDLDKIIENLRDIHNDSIKISSIAEKQLNILIQVCSALKEIIEETNKNKEYRYFEFVSKLNEKINGLSYTEQILQKRSELEVLYRKWQNFIFFQQKNKKCWFKDIFDDLFELIGEAYLYYIKRSDTNFMAHTHYKTSEEKGKIYERKYLVLEYIDWEMIKQKLSMSKVLILDASADEKIYKLLAEKIGKKLEFWSPKIERYDRNILQFTDGNYYKESLSEISTWNRIINLLKVIIENHRTTDPNGTINLVISKELEDNLKKDIIYKNLRIMHFGNIRGLNDAKNDKAMIIIGVNEPPINELRDEVECWSGNKINIERDESKIEGHYYKDELLQKFLEHNRENEIEQIIERLRFYLESKDKICYLISKLNISFPTEKITINEFIRKQLKPLIISKLKKKDYETAELYSELQKEKIKIGTYKEYKEVIKELIRNKVIEPITYGHNKQVLHLRKI